MSGWELSECVCSILRNVHRKSSERFREKQSITAIFHVTEVKVYALCLILLLITFREGSFSNRAPLWPPIVQSPGMTTMTQYTRVKLPHPRPDGVMSVEKALRERRSVREYRKGRGMTMEEVSQLLWAAQGITHPDGLRTSPSAGAMYPLEIYLVSGDVQGLSSGVYRYDPLGHDLVETASGEKRKQLSVSSLDQAAVQDAPILIVVAAVFEKTTAKYGTRGVRYVYLEAGHVAQNVALQAVALGLACVTVAAFHDGEVKRAMSLGEAEEVLYLIPVGRK